MKKAPTPHYTRRIALQGGTVLLGLATCAPLLANPPAQAGALKSGFAGDRIGLTPEDRDYLLNPDHVPQYGSSQANVVIAEFSDFRCPHCRSTTATLRRAFKRDGEVLWTFASLPILGLDSQELARLGYAAHEEGRYPDWHFTVMSWPGRMRATKAPAIAESLGLDFETLRTRIRESDYDTQIRNNLGLAQRLGIRGTPGFVVFNRQAQKTEKGEFPAQLLRGERNEEEFITVFQQVRKLA